MLKRQISIASDEDIELSLSQSEQIPVFDPIPTHFLDRFDVVAGKFARQSPVQAFVKKDVHIKR